ncbi:MAG: 3-dehydroquinate synthase [Chlamydiae bacterium]|nr:3-dehydroquinate synthase [Chlamydiota bacterium]
MKLIHSETKLLEMKIKTSRANLLTEVAFGVRFAFEEALPKLIDATNKKIVLITDSNIEKLYQSNIEALNIKTFSFPAGEASKTRETKALLEDLLLSHHFGKDSHIIALGGGVVTDLVGFLAATYCRGVTLTLVPTTLLGMVDACLGGKTGVNTPYGKNAIGSFYPPTEVLIDVGFLTKLPQEQLVGGMVEVIKYGLIQSKPLFETMQTSKERWDRLDLPFIMEIIQQSLKIKHEVIIEDPFEEKGTRRILNFGHTMGHALETLENYHLDHGSAVAIGMAAASLISMNRELLSQKEFDEILNLLALYNMPVHRPAAHSIDDLMSLLARDKKAQLATPRFVLLKEIGVVGSYDGEYCDTVSFEEIETAFNWIYKEL